MAETSADESAALLVSSDSILIRPVQRSPLQRKLAVYLILISSGLERLAFYSLAGNLTFFLDSHLIQWNFPHTIIAPLIFLGVSYISALVFSCVSDGKLGRANTIIIGFTMYTIGYVFVTLFANEHIHQNWCPSSKNGTDIDRAGFFDELCVAFILPTLVVTAMGVGAVQANMAVFGAEQVREQKTRTRYFDVYYAVVNTGGLIAFGAIAYLQINTNYFIGYLVPGGCLILSFIFFLLGYRCYIHLPSQNSLLIQFFPVLCSAFRSRRIYRSSHSHAGQRVDESESSHEQSVNEDNEQASLTSTRSACSFLDYAKIEHNGRFPAGIVNDIKSLRRIIAVFLLLTPYWLLYVQVETTFIVQGAHMKLPTSFEQMPVVWLSLGNQIIIIVTILLLNTFVYKRLQASGRSFSIKSRITIGMISAALAMCMAGTVEVFRQNICQTQNFTQTIGDKSYLAANMTIFYQFPQYVGIGLSEVFTSVASLEFAYLAAPRSAQSLIMSLRFCSAGLSSFLGSGIVMLLSIENGQDPSKRTADYSNDPRYYTYFFVLAGLQLVFVLIFLGCDRKYQLLKLPNLHLNPRHFQRLTSAPVTA